MLTPSSNAAGSPARDRVLLLCAVLLTTILIALLLLSFPTAADASSPGEHTQSYSGMRPFNCTYVVQPGDDLFRIGLHFNVSWWDLAWVNHIPNPHLIFVGMVLRVPCTTPSQPPIPPVCSTYTVQRGEWLTMIAAKFGVAWQDIAAANRLRNPNLIFPGQQLAIPCSSNAADEFKRIVTDNAAQITDLNSRLQQGGLLPRGQSVLDLVNQGKAAGWAGKSACPQSSAEPFQIVAAPVRAVNEIPITTTRSTALGAYSTYALLGLVVLPRCAVSQILQQGFVLTATQGATLYAAYMFAGLPTTPGTAQLQQQAQPGGAPQLAFIAPSASSDRVFGPGHLTPRTPVPGESPLIQLGSFCLLHYDGFTYCWP